jgi:hypothetical protein
MRNIPPVDPAVALCLGTYGDPRGVSVSYERGTPVRMHRAPSLVRSTPDQNGRMMPCLPLGCHVNLNLIKWRLGAGGSSSGKQLDFAPNTLGNFWCSSLGKSTLEGWVVEGGPCLPCVDL